MSFDAPSLDDAACREVTDPDVFFQDHDTMPAIMVCAVCPIATRRTCLRWALDHEGFGVWGGMSAYDRERLRVAKGIELRPVTGSRGVRGIDHAAHGREATYRYQDCRCAACVREAAAAARYRRRRPASA